MQGGVGREGLQRQLEGDDVTGVVICQSLSKYCV